jgi:hypothetical protein
MNSFNSVITFQSLKQAYQDRLLMYYQGGTWRATAEFVAWVWCQAQTSTSSTVAIDATGEPIEIQNMENFFQQLNEHLQSVNIKYFSDYTALRQTIHQEYRNLITEEQQKDE